MKSTQSRRPRSLGWVAAILVGIGCASPPKPPQAHHVDLLVDSPGIANQSLTAVGLEFPWELDNGGPANATVDGVRWTLQVDGYPEQAGRAQPALRCPPGTTLSDRIRVDAPLRMAEAPGATAADAVVRYRMEATFDVGTLVGPEAFVADWSGELLAPRRPTVTVHSEAARYGGRAIEFHFAIGIENPNPFPLPLQGLDFNVFVDDVEVTRGQLARGETVSPSAELQFDVSRLVGHEDLHELAAALAGRSAIAYRVDSVLRAEDLVLSSPVSGEIYFAHQDHSQ